MRLTYENLYECMHAAADILDINANEIIIDIYRDAEDSAIGYCSGDIDEVHIGINQCLRGNDWVEVLAHEMIHARQYLNGELEDAGPLQMYWHGNKFVLVKELFDHDAYMRTPWEREAYSGQTRLMNQIKEKVDAR